MKRIFAAFCLLLLAGCGEKDEHGYLGYVVGEDALIAAPQPGWVAKLAVQRGQQVKRGDLLFTLDDTRETASRDQAVATLAQAAAQMRDAKATLALAQKELVRQSGLMKAHAGIAQNYDIAKSNYQQALARIAQIEAQEKQAQAVLAGARYQLSERDIVAKTEGRVEDIYFREGEYAPAMTPVVSVLPPKNIYVRFFVPETEFAKMKMGRKVSITCDSCAKNITATVTFIAQQQEFTPPVIFSVGSREKLVFKLEARAPGGLKLNPGQPVEVHPL
ncbi:MAG TPA: efflux RND transporter periplasmic adaptor subunit [Rhizomicrobium sp.]|jgi:HlyD family secretion protein|nr:efflux RND transporter periplasmic adaptor subunit [Rhizomicrobium sp.]